LLAQSYTSIILFGLTRILYRTSFPLIALLTGLYVTVSCSTEKTGWAHRQYHNTLAHFNGYFNAKEIMKEAEASLDETMQDDYGKRLTVYKEIGDNEAQQVSTQMDEIVEKCTRVIKKNSIRKRGKEHVKWIDDSYFLMGKAFYYKLDFPRAQQLFNFVARRYKEEDTRLDAQIWLCRSLLRQENYIKAEKVVNHLASEPELTEAHKVEIKKIYADLYLKQDNVPLAIPEIKSAASRTKNKDDRIRLTYLLGQLLREEGERFESMKMFESILKMHPDYRMEFYTQIQMAMSYNLNTGGAEEVRKMLFKMLNDEKYIEFQDQIYYALAEMSYNEKDIEQTIDYLLQSTEVSTINTEQKGESFLRLGQIYFDRPDYRKAQMYYDSAVSYLPSEFENYQEIVKLSTNLNDLVEQTTIIQHQDSLQRVAGMSEKERDRLIQNIIAKRIEEEEQKIAEREIASGEINQPLIDGGPGSDGGGLGGPLGPAGGSSKWYFYNPTLIESGKSDFKQKWGNRPNEDHWRRSNKQQQFANLDEVLEESDDPDYIVTADGDTVSITGDWLDPAYYLKELPLTPEAMAKSDQLIKDAYYALALVYRDKMEDIPRTIETFEELNKRYPEHEKQLEVYYALYILFGKMDDPSSADFYKNLILSKYPNSDFAMLIKDPDYLNRDSEEYKRAVAEYERIYKSYFSRGYYVQTVRSCDEAILIYGETKLKPKFELMRAIARGNTEGKEAMKADLQDIANRYSENEHGLEAQKLLASLSAQEQAEKERIEAEKEAEKAKDIEQFGYKFEPMSKHNYVIILNDQNVKMNQLKNAIARFNAVNYRMDGLRVSDVIYDRSNSLQMLTVKVFGTGARALNYQNNFESSPEIQKLLPEGTIGFVVSFNNYAIFYKSKDHDRYMKWQKIKYAEL
jgi:tetratricopeptide (TPR) repeat protein